MKGKRYLRLREVRARYSTSKTTIYRWMETGGFPRPLPLGPNTRAWDEAELDRFDEERRRERDGSA